ncbi:DEKNAAC103047 [Brettanomyces naardenensis]|uniref:DEKNAAC103047 n=1 Tax=Brettanomyces naardenensis TaxID=13370 RepID=A0A448YM97_BRENA|nr:DEKNAAC103047 [Brettanomyces naardenensis]
MLEEISLNLIQVCDSIIEASEAKEHSQVNQYSRNGKKYRQTSDGNFRRVQEENKYLVVGRDYSEFKKNYSICSSYYILKNQGSVLSNYRDLCLSIIFTSREIELNKWYEPDTKICNIDECHYDPSECETEAVEYISNISGKKRADYVKMGCSLLAATKINFYQSDHHVSSPTLEGQVLKELVMNICADESSLSSPDVYNALRAFCHWCSIKGVLYCLGMPHLAIDNTLMFRFRTFPKLEEWIKESVFERYPAGTSKYSLVKKSLITISHSAFGKVITFPKELDAAELFNTCKEIEADPIRFHVRAASLNLSESSPLEASGLCQDIDKYVEFISIIFHAGSYKLSSKVSSSSKLIKYAKVKHKPLFKSVQHMANRMRGFERRAKLSNELLTERLGGEVDNSVYEVVNKYALGD